MDSGKIRPHGRAVIWVIPRQLPLFLLLSFFRIPVDHPVEGKVFATQMTHRVTSTQYGKLRGLQVTLPDPELPQVEAYLGLEYASLLAGDLRFMPPTSPVNRWSDVRPAIKFKPVCPQKLPDLDGEALKRMPTEKVEHLRRLIPFLERQNEDCLNLNIYVPVLPDKNETDLLPVVVFVHGESYEIGTGNAYDGSVMAAFGRMLVVTLNYRLGVLGFLSTGDVQAHGNYGLLDILAALHWVNDNIEAFRGDPHRVTLFGHGHGAALVNLLIISPLCIGRNLFKRTIMHSGTALSSWSLSSDPLRHTKQLADRYNCSRHWGQSVLMIQCLKLLPWEDLVNFVVDAPKYLSAFGPTVGGRSVLPARIHNLLADSCSVDFGRTAMLVGFGASEGLGYMADADIRDGLSETRMRKILRTFVRNSFSYHQQKIYEILLHNYGGWDRPRDAFAMLEDLEQLLGDAETISPASELARFHASCVNSPTYLYTFKAQPRSAQVLLAANRPSSWNRELAYIFGAPLADGIDPFSLEYTDEEKKLSQTVLTYWTNFITTGRVESRMDGGDTADRKGKVKDGAWETAGRVPPTQPAWPEYDTTRQHYMSFGTPSRVDHHFRGDKMALWLDLIPRIHRPEGAEFEPSHHQLDDHENLTSFEDDGLTKLEIKPLELDRVTQPTVEISSKTRSTRIQSKTPNLQSTEVKVRRTSSKPAGLLHPVTEPNAHVASTVVRDQSKEVDSKADKISQEASGSISSVALTITVAFALVALNLLVFAAACCQLRRLKKTKELSAAGKGDINADASETEYLRGREKGEQDMEIEPPSRNNSNYYTNTNSRHPSNSKSSGRHRSNSDCHSCNCNSTPQPPRKLSPHQSNSHNQHSQPPPPPPLQHRYALIIDGAETYLRHSDGEDDMDIMNGCVVEPRSSSPTQSDQDSSTLV